jgi:AraC-like DNA-binding protein
MPPDTRLFFEALVRLAPSITTVRKLCVALRVRPSTLMSRFGRAGLPSPKSYLAATRLLHASLLFEDAGFSVADVAYRLEYSSPQSFGRHLRALMGVSGVEFRRRFSLAAALERYLELMILPYRTALRAFHPLSSGAWDSGH